MKNHPFEFTEVLSDLYDMPDTKVWVKVTDSVELMQGRDLIVLPRDEFRRFVAEVAALIAQAEQS